MKKNLFSTKQMKNSKRFKLYWKTGLIPLPRGHLSIRPLYDMILNLLPLVAYNVGSLTPKWFLRKVENCALVAILIVSCY
jgi:hypothetical protein